MTNLHIAALSARRLINDDDLAEGRRPDITAHSVEYEPAIGLDNVETVLREAVRRLETGEQGKGESDAWLGPRLHAALRVPRRLAGDPGLWLHLGLTIGFDYTVARFGPNPAKSRFTGRRDQHALARLWWTAELFRNGPDYAPTTQALTNQDIVNTVLRIDAAHHRPTCQAVIKVRSRADSDVPMGGREANALSTAINCTATTLVLQSIGPDVPSAPDNVAAWIGDADNFNVQDYFDLLPDGPDDEQVPEASVDALAALFTELLANAPVRGDTSIDHMDPADESSA